MSEFFGGIGPFNGIGPSHSSGLVPDPGLANNLETYLRCDGTWANPGVDELRNRLNQLVIWLLANGLELPPDVTEGI